MAIHGHRIKLHNNIIQLGFGPSGTSKFFQGFYKPESNDAFSPGLEKKGEKFAQYFFGVLMDKFFSPE